MRLAVLDELRRLVPFDAFAWLLTDPESGVGTAPIADVPCLPDCHVSFVSGMPAL